MAPHHQCEATDSEQSTVSSKIACLADTGLSQNDHRYDVHMPRRLNNIVKLCDTCDTLHPSGSVCLTCVNGTSPI